MTKYNSGDRGVVVDDIYVPYGIEPGILAGKGEIGTVVVDYRLNPIYKMWRVDFGPFTMILEEDEIRLAAPLEELADQA